MSDTLPRLKLVFSSGAAERSIDEARDRGYLSHVYVEVNCDCLYPIYFYTPIRLQQDLEESVKDGVPYIAYPGMIILPEITRDAMDDAEQRLHKAGFFEYMVATTREKISLANPYQWPP